MLAAFSNASKARSVYPLFKKMQLSAGWFSVVIVVLHVQELGLAAGLGAFLAGFADGSFRTS